MNNSSRHIAIIGKGRGWNLAPQDVESWGVNDLHLRRDVDLSFHMHDLTNPVYVNDVDIIKEKQLSVVCLKKYPEITTAIEFPKHRLHTDYCTNSISYMIAYAIMEGVTKIDMYGVVCEVDLEYAEQKPCIEYWIGYARGLGIEVNVHGVTRILKSKNVKMYGYNCRQEKF